ncbi:MAG: hypothetical protein M3401_05765, partial [Actinomycetota bacterium]|nr:hypothetical protein [Actinomycetota bacterium]
RPTPVARRPAPSRRAPSRLGRRWIALATAIAAIAAVTVVLLTGDGGNDAARNDKPVRELAADAPVQVVTRPNSLAFSGRSLAVLSARSGDLEFVDASAGTPGPRVDVGSGASAVASGFGSLWVTKFRTRSLLRIDPRSRLRAGAAIALPTPGKPVAVAAGEGAVWVGTHEDSGIDNVIKVAPRGAVTRVIRIPGGVQDLATGAGAVWVTNRSRPAVRRISVRNGKQREIRVGPEPQGLAVGAGAVWVAGAGDDSVTRIDSKTLRTEPVRLNVPPDRVAVGGGSVWVTARAAASLIRIDPRRREVRHTIPTGHGPFAVGVYRGRSVWLTLVEDNAIQRVRFK